MASNLTIGTVMQEDKTTDVYFPRNGPGLLHRAVLCNVVVLSADAGRAMQALAALQLSCRTGQLRA